MRVHVFLVAYFVLQAFWIAGAVAAYKTKTLTQAQMETLGVQRGMSYLWHVGMWSDVIAIHPYLALMTALLWSVWMTMTWAWPMLLLISLGFGMGVQRRWSSSKEVIEAHSGIEFNPISGQPSPTGTMSVVGKIHGLHAGAIFTLSFATLISLIFGYVPWQLAVAGVVLFYGHSLAGTHWLLRLMDPLMNPWTHDENAGKHGIVNIICLALGYFFILWFFISKST